MGQKSQLSEAQLTGLPCIPDIHSNHRQYFLE